MTDDLEREIMQHAACLSIAEGAPGWETPTPFDSLAMVTVRELRRRYEALGGGPLVPTNCSLPLGDEP